MGKGHRRSQQPYSDLTLLEGRLELPERSLFGLLLLKLLLFGLLLFADLGLKAIGLIDSLYLLVVEYITCSACVFCFSLVQCIALSHHNS